MDADPQASLSISLGHHQPDELPVTLSTLMGKVLTDQTIAPGEGILHHPEGIGLMPSNIELSGMEVSLVNAISRETILRQYLDTVRRQLNPKLQIDGILLTMVDSRTNFAKDISALLRETYGGKINKIKVFASEITHSVLAKEISAEGKSIFAHDPGGKVAAAYQNLTKESCKQKSSPKMGKI